MVTQKMPESLVWAATDVTTDTIPICPHELYLFKHSASKPPIFNNIC